MTTKILWTLAISVLAASACFDFDDYTFPADGVGGTSGSGGVSGSGTGGSGASSGNAGTAGSAGDGGGGGSDAGPCSSGVHECDGNTPRQCDGEGWIAAEPCSGETPTCYGAGVCGCADGLTRCTDSGTREVCAQGSWQSQAGQCARVTQVAAGNAHTCALLSTGAVRCWGEGPGEQAMSGKLGYGGTADIGSGIGMYPSVAGGPAALFSFASPDVVQRLAVGRNHTCITHNDGSVQCWGDNDVGQLGVGHTAPVLAMGADVVFATNERATRIALGAKHTCAVISPSASVGGVRCWGENEYGQLGANAGDDVGCGAGCVYAEVVNGSVVFFGMNQTAVEVTAGAEHTCAILNTSGVRCWGRGLYGRLGYGDAQNVGDINQPYIDEEPDLSFGSGLTATQVSAGAEHTCAVLSNGAVRCWGLGLLGRLGNGSLDNVGDGTSNVYPTVALGPNVNFGSDVKATKVVAGGAHSCALLETGLVRCWGAGALGQLGNGSAPELVATGTSQDVEFGPGVLATDLSAGTNHTCALVTTGGVRCWGSNAVGQLGTGDLQNVGDDEAVLNDVVFEAAAE